MERILFTKDGCPSCKVAARLPHIDKVVNVTEYDIMKYSITQIPTLIILDNNRVVDMVTGYQNIKNLQSST